MKSHFSARVSEGNDFNLNNTKIYSTDALKQHLGTAAGICRLVQRVSQRAHVVDLESVGSGIAHRR